MSEDKKDDGKYFNIFIFVLFLNFGFNNDWNHLGNKTELLKFLYIIRIKYV